jgi:hypothetical protein
MICQIFDPRTKPQQLKICTFWADTYSAITSILARENLNYIFYSFHFLDLLTASDSFVAKCPNCQLKSLGFIELQSWGFASEKFTNQHLMT